MKRSERINFVMIDILENWRFWNAYFEDGDYEGAGREVIAQANALLKQDNVSNERAAMLLEEGMEFKRKKSEAGRKGGIASAMSRTHVDDSDEPEAEKEHAPAAFNPYQRIKPPEARDEVFNFGNDQGIPDWCVIEWYEMNSARDWKDKNGKTIYNWKGALVNYHKSKGDKK